MSEGILIEEIWKPVVGFEDYYRVSNTGKVFSIRSNRYLNQAPKHTGYRDIELNVNGKASYKRMHRLVAEAFIPNPLNKPAVNHIDGNKLNNNASNLEWVTNSENMQHAVDTGLQPYSGRNCRHRLFNDSTSIIFDYMVQVMEATGLTKDKAKEIKKNKLSIPTGKYKGFFLETVY